MSDGSQRRRLACALLNNSPGLCPGRDRSPALSFDINPFHFLALFSKLLQSKPTQAAIFEQFFDFGLQSTQTWTRIRATIRGRAEIELEFELELLFLLRSAHARRRLWEPSDMGIGWRFQVGGPLFLKRFSEGLFSEKWCQMDPKMVSKKVTKSDKKRT